MTSLSKLILILSAFVITACTPAKSPLNGEGAATFALIPDRVSAEAELGQATPDSFGRPRTQRLNFVVCLQSQVTGEPIAKGTSFAIVDAEGHSIDRATEAGGCLHWTEVHGVSPLAPERNVRVERRIRALANHRGEVLLTFNVKPWLEGKAAVQSASNQERFADPIQAEKGLSFEDQYPVPPVPAAPPAGVVAATDRTTDRPHILLADNHLELNYVSGGRSPEFEIDPFLTLSVPYRFTFSILPMITRRLFSGARQSEPMTSGRVRLTLVFFASARGDYREDNRYLTSAQVEGEVEPNGAFSGAIIVKYPHAHFASGRQTVLAQVTALGQSSVDAGSFSGSLSFIDQQGPMLVLKDGRDAEAIHQDGLRTREALARTRGTPLDEFVKARDVVRMNVNDLPANDVLSAQELSTAMNYDGLDAAKIANASSERVVYRLCQMFAKAGQSLGPVAPTSLSRFLSIGADLSTDRLSTQDQFVDRYCGDVKRLPGQFINVQQLDFIEELVQKTPRNVKIITYSNQDFGLHYGRDKAKVSAQNLAFGLHAQAPELFGIFGDMSYVQSRILTRSERSVFSQSQTMAIDMGTLEINARVRSCVLITGKHKIFPAKPWLICQPEARPAAWIQESFYYYSQMFGANHSPFIDPFNAQTGVKLLVRGRYQMQRISAKLESPDYATNGFNVFIQTKQPDLSEFDTTGRLDELTTQDVPGAILRN